MPQREVTTRKLEKGRLNLKDMLFNISEIGNGLEFRGTIASLTIRIDGMTVAGE